MSAEAGPAPKDVDMDPPRDMPMPDPDPVPADAPKAKKPAAKRKRASAPNASAFAKVKGKLGALQAFNSLPLDILADICAELDHETLFTLTVTSRPFRNLLLSNFATKLWVDARAQAGLPELETDDLTEVQYANLVHARICQLCRKKNISKVNFTLRTRLCPACTKANVLLDHNGKTAKLNHIPVLSKSCAPHNRVNYGSKEFFCPALIKVHQEMQARFYSKESERPILLSVYGSYSTILEQDVGYVVLPREPRPDPAATANPAAAAVPGAPAPAAAAGAPLAGVNLAAANGNPLAVLAQMLGGRGGRRPGSDDDSDDEAYNVWGWAGHRKTLMGPPTEKDAFVRQRVQYIKQRETDGRKLDAWLEHQKLMKGMDKDVVRSERKEAAEKRLRDLGYGADDFKDPEWRSFGWLKEPKPLTDKIWSNNEKKVTTFLDGRRSARAEVERVDRLVKRRLAVGTLRKHLLGASPPPAYYVPPLTAFLALPASRPLWEPETGVVDLGEDGKETIKAIEVELEALTARLKKDYFTTLCKAHDAAREAVPSSNLGRSPVEDIENPTEAELAALFGDDALPVVRCTSCRKHRTLAAHVAHEQACSEPRYYGHASSVRDLDYKLDNYAVVDKHWSVRAETLVTAKAFQLAVEKAEAEKAKQREEHRRDPKGKGKAKEAGQGDGNAGKAKVVDGVIKSSSENEDDGTKAKETEKARPAYPPLSDSEQDDSGQESASGSTSDDIRRRMLALSSEDDVSLSGSDLQHQERMIKRSMESALYCHTIGCYSYKAGHQGMVLAEALDHQRNDAPHIHRSFDDTMFAELDFRPTPKATVHAHSFYSDEDEMDGWGVFGHGGYSMFGGMFGGGYGGYDSMDSEFYSDDDLMY